MFKKFIARTLVVMLIIGSTATVYAGPENEPDNNVINLIKVEKSIEAKETPKTPKSTEKTDKDWIHIISPKINQEDNSVYSDGELIVSYRVDCDEEVYFMLTKVRDSNIDFNQEEKELSDEDKFIVYSLAINKKIKTDEKDKSKTVIEEELEVVNVETTTDSENNESQDESNDAVSEETSEHAVAAESIIGVAVEENPTPDTTEAVEESTTDESKEGSQSLMLIHAEVIEPEDIIGVNNPIMLKDITPGEYKMLFFRKSFKEEIIKIGERNNNEDVVINVDNKDNKFEVIEFTVKSKIRALEDSLKETNSATDILLGE